MSQLASHKISLEMFEGPLDLLLHLIRKSDVPISDIPVALILDQYLEALEVMKELNIDLAGDFILMASELALIKSRMLLKTDDQETPEEDPRSDLVARLKAYQDYKRASQWLTLRPLLGRDVFKRPPLEKPEFLEEETTLQVEPFSLFTAFNEILKRAPKNSVHEVSAETISVTERIYEILERLKEAESILFESIFESDRTRTQIVTTFLAILEMAKLKMIHVLQTDRYGPIRIQRRMDSTLQEISYEPQ